MRRLTDQEWETFATRMKPIATRRLSQLRRADGDSDDVLASVWRTYHERAGKDLDARRLEENYNGDVFKLLLYHLFRKINRARKQETSLKRSAQRSADLDPSSESFFWSQFNSDKEPEASDVDLFLDRLFEPLEKVSSFTRAVAELKIAVSPGMKSKMP